MIAAVIAIGIRAAERRVRPYAQDLHAFCAHAGCPDGENPQGGLDAAGNLYGTTSGDGSGPSAATACASPAKPINK